MLPIGLVSQQAHHPQGTETQQTSQHAGEEAAATPQMPTRHDCPELHRYLDEPDRDPGHISLALLQWASVGNWTTIDELLDRYPNRLPYVDYGSDLQLKMLTADVPHGIRIVLSEIRPDAVPTLDTPINALSFRVSADSDEQLELLGGAIASATELRSLSVCFSDANQDLVESFFSSLEDSKSPVASVAIRFEHTDPAICDACWESLLSKPLDRLDVIIGPGCGATAVETLWTAIGAMSSSDDESAAGCFTLRMDQGADPTSSPLSEPVKNDWKFLIYHVGKRGVQVALPHTWAKFAHEAPLSALLRPPVAHPGQVLFDIPAHLAQEEVEALFLLNARLVSSDVAFGPNWQRGAIAGLLTSIHPRTNGVEHDLGSKVADVLLREQSEGLLAFRSAALVSKGTQKAAHLGRLKDERLLLQGNHQFQMDISRSGTVGCDPAITGEREFPVAKANSSLPPVALAPIDRDLD